MKILLLLSRCDQTGMTTHTLDLGRALVSLGHRVTLLVGRRKKNLPESEILYQKFLEVGVQVVSFREAINNSLHLKIISFLDVLFFIIWHRFDIIHIQSPYLSFMPWLLHKKFVSTLHVNDLIRCFYYKNATHLIAISRETKDYARRIFGYNDKDITIVNHGVSSSFATLLSAEQKNEEKLKRNLPVDKLIIGLVGSIEKRKGHDVLLNAIALLPKELLATIHIVFLGSSKDGKTKEWLDTLIEKTNMEGRVSRFEYQSSDIFYKLFDVFVLPSRLEGFPVVVIEAMSSGCCCVRSNVEGAYDQIDDGKTGFLFENENVEQLSSILKFLIENPDRRTEVAKAGREKALKEFTSEVMAKKTIDVYKQVINEY